MSTNNKTKQVRVSKSTHDDLTDLIWDFRVKNYDDAIQKLIDFFKEHKGCKEVS